MEENNLIDNSKSFYNQRYSDGYMEDWPADKKKRVADIFDELSLPNQGIILDYGCGNGVFSGLIKSLLPGWQVYGCDISEIAINNAQKIYPDIIFLTTDKLLESGVKFDFIFSHHVLEHVFNIKNSFAEINQLAKQTAYQFHIFPCGNEGSFEYKLCQLRSDGINPNRENRFFFEDAGHVRRLTTTQCIELNARYGFKLKLDYYSNQYLGALSWISASNPRFVLGMFNPFKGKNITAQFKLFLNLILFMLICVLRMPPIIYNRFKPLSRKSICYKILTLLLYLPAQILNPLDKYFNNLAVKEWQEKKQLKNGSEMYLVFNRT